MLYINSAIIHAFLVLHSFSVGVSDSQLVSTAVIGVVVVAIGVVGDDCDFGVGLLGCTIEPSRYPITPLS